MFQICGPNIVQERTNFIIVLLNLDSTQMKIICSVHPDPKWGWAGPGTRVSNPTKFGKPVPNPTKFSYVSERYHLCSVQWF